MMTLTFSRRGHRRKAGYGLVYRAQEGPYELYFGDMVSGLRWRDYGLRPRWLAICNGRIISRHRTRETAIAACERHMRGEAKPKQRKARR